MRNVLCVDDHDVGARSVGGLCTKVFSDDEPMGVAECGIAA